MHVAKINKRKTATQKNLKETLDNIEKTLINIAVHGKMDRKDSTEVLCTPDQRNLADTDAVERPWVSRE